MIAILRAKGFEEGETCGSHCTYTAVRDDVTYDVQVDLHHNNFDDKMIKYMIQQSGLGREGFYGATKRTAKKIGLR